MKGFDGKRIYFSPCGIGLGHASRNLPIAEELKRNGAEILFSTYLEGVGYTRSNGFKVVEAPAISMSNDMSGSIDLKLSTVNQGVKAFPTFMRQVITEIEYMKAFEPDVVVSDSRLSSIFAAKILRIPVLLIINQFTPLIPMQKDMFMLAKVADGVIMTLVGRGWGYSDKILIPDFPPPDTLSVDSLRIPKPYQCKIELVGAILPKKPNQINNRVAIREYLGVDKDQSLIYAGISGPRGERIPLLKILEPIFADFPSEYRVLMSLGNPQGDPEPVVNGSLIKMSWIPNRFDYLNACDIVISRGGHETLMQSICYSKPSIIIPVPKHPEQYGNARRAQELGVARAIHQRYISKEALFILIDEVLSDEEYKRNLSILNSKHLGAGVENCIKALSEIIQ